MPSRSATQPSALRPSDEKITINLGHVDLGQVDLLVQEGFYSNRTDLIRTAIRNQLAAHGDAVRQAASRKTLALGIQHYTAADLQALKKADRTLHIRALGLVSFAPDVTPALALATVESLTVLGALHAPPAVKAALLTRMR
jgi:Arc/MetJ-type ribon-helix-helix transcriptional regulator